MSEVGALVVNLTAETAKFREDLGKVKRDLDDLKGKAGEAGDSLENIGEAKGGLMLVEDAIGVRLPRHLNSLIAQIPGVGAAFAIMLPIAGVAVAIKIVSELIEKHRKYLEEIEQMENAQISLQGTIGSVYRGLSDKLLQAGIAADELSGNHLAAIKKQLELIDNQSLSELAQSFETLAGAAEKSLSLIKAGMFEVGSGGEGAKASLDRFQAQYEMLLKTGKSDEANDLLEKKITREEAILRLQEAAASKDGTGLELMNRRVAAVRELHDLTGQVVDFDDKSIESEKQLLDILHAESNARETILQTAAVKKSTTSQKGHIQELEQESALQKIVTQGVLQHIAAVHKLAQSNAEAQFTSQKGADDTADDTLQQKLQEIDLTHTAAVQAAQDELNAKRTELDQDHKLAVGNVAKLKELDAKRLNDYKAFLDSVTQADANATHAKIDAAVSASNENAKATEEAAQQGYDDILKAAIQAAEEKQKVALIAARNEEAIYKKTANQVRDADIRAVNDDTAAQVAAIEERISKIAGASAAELKQIEKLEAQKKAIVKKGEDEITQIKTAAAQRQAQEVSSAENRMEEAISSDIAKSIVMNKSLAQSFKQTGEQMAEQMLKNLIMAELTGNKQKLIDAKTDAANSFNWASAWGGPIAGGVAAAAAFAGVMSFEVGGKIPGSGAVPIVGHGGETVVTKALTDRVESAERGAERSSGSGDIHMHFAPQIHAMDAEGVDRVLQKHSSTFERHVRSTIRRMNK